MKAIISGSPNSKMTGEHVQKLRIGRSTSLVIFPILLLVSSAALAQASIKAITCTAAYPNEQKTSTHIVEWSDLNLKRIVFDGLAYFDGQPQPMYSFSHEVKVNITPTLLFLLVSRDATWLLLNVNRVTGNGEFRPYYPGPDTIVTCVPGKTPGKF